MEVYLSRKIPTIARYHEGWQLWTGGTPSVCISGARLIKLGIDSMAQYGSNGNWRKKGGGGREEEEHQMARHRTKEIGLC